MYHINNITCIVTEDLCTISSRLAWSMIIISKCCVEYVSYTNACNYHYVSFKESGPNSSLYPIQTSGVADCLFKATLYDSCNLTPTEATQFSPSDELSGGANVSFSGLGVIYSPLIGSAIFNPLTTNEVMML